MKDSNRRMDDQTGHILVIEDNPDDLHLISDILADAGYSVHPAINPELAFNFLESNKPDVILLDIRMPELDGFGICEKLKKNENTSMIPIIFISILDEISDKIQAFEAGGVDYLTKPIKSEEVLARVKIHLNLERLRRNLELRNEQLRNEIRERKQTERILREIQSDLENRVRERTLELSESNKALKLDEERLNTLLKLNEMDSISEDEIIDFTLEEAVRLTESDIGYIHFLNEDGKTIRLCAWSRKVKKTCKPDRKDHYPLEEAGIWADSIRTGRPVYHNRFQQITGRKKFPADHPEVVKHMSVPIHDQGNPVAVIGVGNKQTDYNERDARQLTLLIKGMWRLIQKKKEQEERDKLERQLRRTQKLEAIGTLAGGIAHDFNNILFSIIGYTEMALDDLPEGSPLKKNLNGVLKAGIRAKKLVQQILTFSRQTEQEKKPVKIKYIIKEAVTFLRATLPSTIQIKTNIISNSDILADPTQIHQIIMNLCANAGHAMKDTGGTLSLELTDTILSRDDQDHYLHMKPGRYVKLIIADTGHGMSGEIMDRIYDPFFTTKNKGEGTGLGLSMVHGIVKSHQGRITAYSELGVGTIFTVLLPSIAVETAVKQDVECEIPRGNEKLLIVDDEIPIADMLGLMMEKLGYKVEVCYFGEEALERFRQNPNDFDLVITDLTMPKMPGLKLARSMKDIRKDIPIILCTGFSEMIKTEDLSQLGIRAVVMKPVLKNEITKTLRKVLDSCNIPKA